MGELNFLLSNYSAGEVLALLVVIIFLGVAILKAWEYLWGKIKDHFDIKNNKEQQEKSLFDKIDNVSEQLGDVHASVKNMEEQNAITDKRLEKVEEYVKHDSELEREIIDHNNKIDGMCATVTQRLQDDARWAFKDAYNYYYIKLGSIDQTSLEALESKYEHYKLAGGNSFVDTIMTQIRSLPIKEYGK